MFGVDTELINFYKFKKKYIMRNNIKYYLYSSPELFFLLYCCIFSSIAADFYLYNYSETIDYMTILETKARLGVHEDYLLDDEDVIELVKTKVENQQSVASNAIAFGFTFIVAAVVFAKLFSIKLFV
jgi:hypothetical protein